MSVFIVISLLFFVFSPSPLQGQPLPPSVNLSHNTGDSLSPSIAAGGSRVFVVWVDETPGNDEILFSHSTDGGKSFSEPRNISQTSNDSGSVRIAVEGEEVSVVWSERVGSNWEIFFIRSSDGGQAFSKPLNLSNSPGDSGFPHVVMKGGTVVVAWVDDTPGNDEIFVSRSVNKGASFSPPVNISNNPGNSVFPHLAFSDSTVVVAWSDLTPGNEEVFVSRSPNKGVTFSAPVNISHNPGRSTHPAIAFSGSHLFVVWSDRTPGNTEIFFSHSIDGGVSFSVPLNVSRTEDSSLFPQLATSGQWVVSAWADRTARPRKSQILSSRLGEEGVSFSSPVALSSSDAVADFPAIAVDGLTLFAVWAQNTGGAFDILFNRFSLTGLFSP